jgi:hypothetical protein
MMRRVVDTNVAVAANGRGTNASIDCRMAAIEFLKRLVTRGRTILDLSGEIQEEYRRPRGAGGVPSPGLLGVEAIRSNPVGGFACGGLRCWGRPLEGTPFDAVGAKRPPDAGVRSLARYTTSAPKRSASSSMATSNRRCYIPSGPWSRWRQLADLPPLKSKLGRLSGAHPFA